MTKGSFDPGLTQQFTGEIRRAINKDGSFNVQRRGGGLRSFSSYQYLVNLSWPRFILLLAVNFTVMNLLFAGIYFAIGVQHLTGWAANTGVGSFGSAFFFSVYTFTTVGYGNVYPTGAPANAVAAVEATVGLMTFAVATSLLFARFSRPSARIVFSDSMLVAPYQDLNSLQFRIGNARNNELLELEAKVLLMTVERVEGNLKRTYADLPLERRNVYFFPLTWTVVHVIDAASPLNGKTAADLKREEAEFLILIKAFDETFSQSVNARFSYRHDELVWGARFTPAFRVDPSGGLILELDRINDQKPAALTAGQGEAPALPTL